MKHQHKKCEHELKYCEVCDKVYCERCDMEWSKQLLLTNGTTTTTLGGEVLCNHS